MSTKKPNNTPETAQATTGTTTGKDKMNLYLMIGFGLIALVALFFIFSGDDKAQEKAANKKSQAVESIDGSSKSGPQRTERVYEAQQPRDLNTNQNSQANDSVASSNELQYYTDPVSNVQMVKTPSGLVPVNSKEGRKYIEDFKALQAASGTGVGVQGNPAVGGTISQNEFTTAMAQNNEQTKALDQKLNDAHQRIDELVQLVKKQNETVEKMSDQVRTVQPVVKSPRELAKEIFGKDGERVLKERNKSVSAASVVGDKAYIYDINGDLHLVGVGDVIPGTSVKVKEINQVDRQVLIAE